MSKIILTKEQAEFIEGFKKAHYFGNEETVEITEELPMWAGNALHNLMQFGFGHPLLDANDKEVSDDKVDPEGNFQHNQVPLLIEAIMHGYEIEKGKTVRLFVEFSDTENGIGKEDRKLYYGASVHVTNKRSATIYDLSVEWEAKEVEKLKAQGWKVEEAE